MSSWLDRFMAFVRLYVWPRKPATLPPALLAEPVETVMPPEPERVETKPAPAPPESTPVLIHGQRPNRKTRRAFEAARRKHDKFVEPKGPQPIPIARTSVAPKPEPQETPPPTIDVPIDDPNDFYIVDEWMEGSGDQVLFEESEIYGEFNFRDSILDQLDRYWVYLSRMRRNDPDAYWLYRQLGATLIPYVSSHSRHRRAAKFEKITDIDEYRKEIVLPIWFKQKWPAFGCVAWGANPNEEAVEMTPADDRGMRVWVPKFMYWQKLANVPWPFQPVIGGKIYKMATWWDRPQDPTIKRKWGVPQEFVLHISDDGNRIRALKSRQKPSGEIGQWWNWRIPHEYEDWAKQYGITAQDHLTHHFCDVVQHCERASWSMLRVEVSNDAGLTAVFGISPKRTAYFFQDRDFVLTENGRRQRVFHSVRPHVRKDGTAVPMHFRGMRDFTWAGYRVHITVPGRDHFMLNEFDVESVIDPVHRRDDPDRMSQRQLGAFIKQEMRKGVTYK